MRVENDTLSFVHDEAIVKEIEKVKHHRNILSLINSNLFNWGRRLCQRRVKVTCSMTYDTKKTKTNIICSFRSVSE